MHFKNLRANCWYTFFKCFRRLARKDLGNWRGLNFKRRPRHSSFARRIGAASGSGARGMECRPDLTKMFYDGVQDAKTIQHSKLRKIKSLAWRDRYCGCDYFRETICGRDLIIRQLKNGENTGLGTGAYVRGARVRFLFSH